MASMRQVFELYNTDTEQVEAVQDMTIEESVSRNNTLRSFGEPQRWVTYDNDPLSREYPESCE